MKTDIIKIYFNKWISCILMTILLISMTGCSSQGKTGSTKPSIGFRITWMDKSDEGVAIQKIVDMYNAQNSGQYEVVLQGGDEDFKNIEKSIVKDKDAPILVLPYEYVKDFGGNAKLVDLTSSFSQEQSLFYPELWRLGTVDEKTYGIPWIGDSICLVYNKDLLFSAGIGPDGITSLEAFERALKRVEVATNAKGLGLVGANHRDVSWMVNQFIYGFDSSLVDSTGKKVTINNDQSRAALDYYVNHLSLYAQPTWKEDSGAEVMEAFRNQEVAFEFQGPRGLADIEKNGSPFEVGTISLETMGLKSDVEPLMISIPQNMPVEKQAEATEFIKFMISVEAQKKIVDGEYSTENDAYYPFKVPTRMDLANDVVFEKHPEYLLFMEGFGNPSVDVPVLKWQKVKDEVYAPELHKLMNGEISIDEFLIIVEEKGNNILNEGN